MHFELECIPILVAVVTLTYMAVTTVVAHMTAHEVKPRVHHAGIKP